MFNKTGKREAIHTTIELNSRDFLAYSEIEKRGETLVPRC